MACCGSSMKLENFEKILKKIRYNNEIIDLKLDNLKLEFIPKENKWKSNSIIII